MDCEVIPGLDSSCRFARGLEQNGCAGEEMCCVISLDNLSPEAEDTVVSSVIHTVVLLELLVGPFGAAGCWVQRTGHCWWLGDSVVLTFVA